MVSNRVARRGERSYASCQVARSAMATRLLQCRTIFQTRPRCTGADLGCPLGVAAPADLCKALHAFARERARKGPPTAMTTFPHGFLWGAATAGHQVEGGNVNADLWPLEWAEDSIFAEPSGDACDHYHRYPEDVATLAGLGCNAYRFSLEWSRIEPEPGYFSRAALDHYKRMVACCREHGITPFVTLNHFTTPRWFAGIGGWGDRGAADRFGRYAAR